MRDMLRRLSLAGLGVFSLTKEKAEQVVKELSERGQVNAEEARSLFKDLVEKGEQERAALSQTIRNEIQKIREEVGFVSKQEFKHLEERISRLEAQGQRQDPQAPQG